jgi:ribonuclease R
MELTGTYRATTRKYGFISPQDGDGQADYFVPPRMEQDAWDGDAVRYRLQKDRDDRSIAVVTQVLGRANAIVTGVVDKRRDGKRILIPDSAKLRRHILITNHRPPRIGEKVAVKMQTFGEKPMGSVVETFGRDGSLESAVAAILYQHGIERFFPPEVQQQAEEAEQSVSPQALAGRLDYRERLVITIDGATAKDLDDAVSLEALPNGNRLLGVHIADVSHYVTDGSPLDKEALERGTSVYFADQVVPMLPPALSNGICSLHPRVERLTLSCLMECTPNGEIVRHSLHKSVICSAERMTYADCNALLAGEDVALAETYAHVLPLLADMAQLAKQRGQLRKNRGSLDLQSNEAAVLCDEGGTPVGVVLRESGVSENLIEEFMLAANETVAKHLCDLEKPAVYRVHENPSAEKIELLTQQLMLLGYTLKDGSNGQLQAVLAACADKPEAAIVNQLVLRAQMKARYAHQNLGHFGLAASHYCHFTSPIRRYPDLVVHRILSTLLEGNLHGKIEGRLAKFAQTAAVQSSERELAAMTAEREIEKCYVAAFMAKHVGEDFAAIVSGVSRSGVFVTVAGAVEGLIALEELPADEYIYDEGRLALLGQRAQFRFGMPLSVRCAGASVAAGEVWFSLNGNGTVG